MLTCSSFYLICINDLDRATTTCDASLVCERPLVYIPGTARKFYRHKTTANHRAVLQLSRTPAALITEARGAAQRASIPADVTIESYCLAKGSSAWCLWWRTGKRMIIQCEDGIRHSIAHYNIISLSAVTYKWASIYTWQVPYITVLIMVFSSWGSFARVPWITRLTRVFGVHNT